MRETTSSSSSSVVSTSTASGGAGERRVGARGVGVVAVADLALDGGELGVDARLGQLPPAADGAAGGVGVDEELHVRVREDRGPDVAAVHHHAPAPAPQLLLPGDHQPAHRGMDRDLRRGRADLAGADVAGDVRAVQEHGAVGPERDVGVAQQRDERRLVAGGDARAERLQRERAVHGAGVEEDVAEAGGEHAAGGALPRARRPVDGDDEAALRGGPRRHRAGRRRPEAGGPVGRRAVVPRRGGADPCGRGVERATADASIGPAPFRNGERCRPAGRAAAAWTVLLPPAGRRRCASGFGGRTAFPPRREGADLVRRQGPELAGGEAAGAHRPDGDPLQLRDRVPHRLHEPPHLVVLALVQGQLDPGVVVRLQQPHAVGGQPLAVHAHAGGEAGQRVLGGTSRTLAWYTRATS